MQLDKMKGRKMEEKENFTWSFEPEGEERSFEDISLDYLCPLFVAYSCHSGYSFEEVAELLISNADHYKVVEYDMWDKLKIHDTDFD